MSGPGLRYRASEVAASPVSPHRTYEVTRSPTAKDAQREERETEAATKYRMETGRFKRVRLAEWERLRVACEPLLGSTCVAENWSCKANTELSSSRFRVILSRTGEYLREHLAIQYFTEEGEDGVGYLLQTEETQGRLVARYVPYTIDPDTNVPTPDKIPPGSPLFNEAEMSAGGAYLTIHREHPFYLHVLGALSVLADARGLHGGRFVKSCNESGNVL